MPADIENVDLPSIYIAHSVLEPGTDLLPTDNKNHTYLVNEEVFYEESSEVFYKETDSKLSKVFYEESVKVFCKERVEDGFLQFELYDMDIEDMYCSTPSGSESECGEDHESELRVTLQPVANGYIVNGSSFLTVHQWHTLVTPAVSLQLLQCIACSEYFETKASDDHVSKINHRMALQAFPPLQAYDLSITRKIRNQLHCAVCNEVFDLASENEHFSGKMHEGNLLFSINKASDILDNSLENNTEQPESYHFQTHRMNRTNSFNDNESVDSDNYSCKDNSNFINFQHNYYYDDCEEEETPIFTGQSYASMAKKPKVHTQQYIDVDLGSKKVKVRHDSWHMVISPKLNRFWCMVCKKFDHIRKKPEHCAEIDHLKNLDKCKVVQAYEEYFIRQVDDKLYHCGHCNNLQLIHEMEDHVESNHPRRTRLVSETKNVNSPVKNDRPNVTAKPIVKTDNQSQYNTNGAIQNNITNSPRKVAPINLLKNNNFQLNNNNFNSNNTLLNKNNNTVNKDQSSEANNAIIHQMPGIFDNIVISPFHSKITLPSLAYNIVCKRPTDFYCGLCDMVCQENLIAKHVYEITHLERMQRHPFIAPFGNNLIRAIRDALHCAICNLPIAASAIYIHIKDPQHMNYLEKALKFESPKLPPTGIKIPNVVSQQSLNVANRSNQTLNIGGVNNNGVRGTNNAIGVGNNAIGVTNNGIGVTNNAIGVTNNAIGVTNNSIGVTNNAIGVTNNAIGVTNNAIGVKNNAIGVKNNAIGVTNNAIGVTNNAIGVTNNAIGVTNNGVGIANNGIRVANNAVGITNNLTGVASNRMGVTNNIKPTVDPIVHTTNNAAKYPQIHTEIYKHDKQRTDSYSTDANEEFDDDDDEVDEELEATYDSVLSDDATFDAEEHVYLKLKNNYIKISNTAYNTLVHSGSGARYCFVCALHVQYSELQKHVDGRPHMENMEKYRFLDKYEDHLLRQIYLMYHCAICNVIIKGKELKTHLEWPTHDLQNINLKNIKKTRKTEIKGGVKQIVVSTQKENIYLHDNESKIKILLNVQISDKKTTPEKEIEKDGFSRKNKIVFFHDNVLKISWDSWHGISKIKSGYKCNLCQRDLKGSDIDMHCTSEWHKYALDKPFEKQYAPALIRKINESTLNCLFCNTEVSNKEHLVQEHVNGKKHAKSYEAILRESSNTNTYADCNDDVLML